MTWLGVLDFKLAIFTLGSKECRDITDSANLTLTPTIAYRFLSNHSNKGLFINGSIYWHHNTTILAFDVSMEGFTLITMPDTFNPNFPLVEVEGCGSVVETDIHRQPRLWILKSIKNTHVWEIKEDDYITCWRHTKASGYAPPEYSAQSRSFCCHILVCLASLLVYLFLGSNIRYFFHIYGIHIPHKRA
ncbi:hypothetical protein GBA52_023062 [Prunus armeniaca]|nr:hypothetical protein GBA52_023062 [Prunus armeniaca]